MDPPWNPDQTPTYWITRASRALSRHLDGELRPFGFALGQMAVLRALAGGEARSQAELARGAQVEQSSMAETLGRMARDGVVERQPDPADRRIARFTLSRRSRRQLAPARGALMAADAAAMKGLSGSERATLCALLQRIVENIEGDADG